VVDHASPTPIRQYALTPRETEVLGLIALGLTNAEAAERLQVSVHAVKFHLSHIYGKLGVSNRTEAAVAFQLGAGDSDRPERAGGSVEEANRSSFDGNATAAPYPNCCLHELVARRAAQIPAAAAVVDPSGTQLTYGELDRRANKLAHRLRELAVGPETLVGIAVTRSAAMVVGLLGILKAGGAYVPIDPTYPAERVAYMLEDAEAPVLVTEEGLLADLPLQAKHVVCLDRDWSDVERRPSDPPGNTTDPENLAYVIYTSGSTGKPKGVQIPHRALVNFLTTMSERPGFAADDVLLAVTTLSFDIAGLELYLPLVTGGLVVVAPQEATSDPRELARMIDMFGVTTMQATPTTWRMLVDSGWPGKVGLKALCGGEALPLALADALVERGLELWNMYGPTETTIWSTITPITTRGEPLTIGRPIANTTLHVLDEATQPVPVGVPGELHIGGAGLARGYRGRPDLTAERFIRHPLDSDRDARIYKTGDLVRYREDGEVEFLGRLDNQVKVRGFRIELGEIETVLARHPSVLDAVAVALEDTPGDARIVAYVRQDGRSVGSAELREHAGRSLPAYMVPSAVVTLDEFPLTPNGKVDRRALPAPAFERSAKEYVAPRSALEQRLVDIWEGTLDLRPIGVTDDFFSLGVTSIAAAQLFARVEQELGGRLPLGAIFQAPTVERLAALLAADTVETRWSSLVPIQPNGTKSPLFCVHGGAGTILHLQPLARRLGPDQPFYGLQARGLYGHELPLTTVEEMSEHYLSELRTVQPHGPYFLAGYCFGAIVAFDMAHRLLDDGEEIALLVMFNGPSPPYIRKYGPVAPELEERPVPVRLTRAQRIRRLAVEPWRLVSWARWFTGYLRSRGSWLKLDLRVRLCVALQRPLPEDLRDLYFLVLSHRAERAYQPTPFPARIMMFCGERLYRNPELGWGEFAEAGVVTYEVPGDHKDNRDAMREPHVGFVAEHLERQLAAARDAVGSDAVGSLSGATAPVVA
jgi:amino acid adenylation domain-containing protein